MSHEDEKKLRYKILDLGEDWKARLYKTAIDRKSPALAGQFKTAMWDSESIGILAMILATSFKNNREQNLNYLWAQISFKELCNKRRNTLARKGVTSRLQHFARAWFLNVDTTAKRTTANGIRMPDTQNIFLNSAFLSIFQPGNHRLKLKFLNDSVNIYLDRVLGEQGFKYNVPYGANENDPTQIISMVSTGDQTIESAEKAAESRKEKAAENKQWRVYNDAFVQCAANLWKQARGILGHGYEDPIWSAKGSNLSPSARNLRRELTKTFESVGGYVAALSWYLYVLGTPEKDAKGKLVFDLKIPHRQFKGSDMKPSGYAKHIDAIVSDPDFVYMSQDGWEAAKLELLNYFGEELLEVGPRDGMAYSAKLGYVFGQKPLPTLKNHETI